MKDENSKPHYNGRQYDLEDRCKQFAKDCRIFSKKLPHTVENIEDRKQLTRSSGSVGANYIEANECISKKDFLHRIKISRKESKESEFWLDVCDCGKIDGLDAERCRLQKESVELTKIFGSIYQKSK